MGRTDDLINVAGHRLSTGAMEEIIASHADVAECAVVGAADQIKGMIPIGFIILKEGAQQSVDKIIEEVVEKVRTEIGAVAAFKKAIITEQLPKTRSGKVLRGAIKKIANGSPFAIPPTIENPGALDSIRKDLSAIGYPVTINSDECD